MEGLWNGIKELKGWQRGILAAVVVGSFVLTYGIYAITGDSGSQDLEENQRLIPVRFGNLENQVAINGSISFSNKETLSFGASGVVSQILVEEGQEVEEGEPLISLDTETVAQLQQALASASLDLQVARQALADAENSDLAIAEAQSAVAEAKLALQVAQEDLDALIKPDAQAIAEAESAAADAELALQVAEDELEQLVTPDSQVIATAEAAVVEAEIAFEAARDAMGQDVVNAIADVDAARNDLEAAQRSLDLAPNDDGIRLAQKVFDDAQLDYLDVIKKWIGAELLEEELTLSPDELFEALDFNPELIYNNQYDLFPSGVIGDDLSTRWNEMTVFAWVRLHPSASTVKVTCDRVVEASSSSSTSNNRGVLVAQEEFCVQRDFEDGWEVYEDEIIDMKTLRSQAERDIANAETNLIRAELDLAEAERLLESLSNGYEAELLQKNLVVAEATLAEVKTDLEELLSPDPVEVASKENQVALAKANLAQAKSDLAEVMTPDPAEVDAKSSGLAVAQAAIEDAEAALANVLANRELELALRQAEMASAEATLTAATRRSSDSTLKAPFTGFVSAILVELGQDVGATAEIIEVIDTSIVEVEGVVDEIDVLSLQRGAIASVTMDALPNQELSGVVSTVSSAATSQQGVVTFDVEIRVNVPQNVRLQEGLSAVANVSLNNEQGLLIPNQAISGTFDNPQVVVMNGNGFQPQPVVLGSSDGFWTVVHQGLAEGQEVLIEVREVQAQQLGFGGFRGGGGGGGGGGR